MSHSIPTELANARIARETAWDKYDAALGTPFQPELWKVVNWLEERATALYNEWQKQGGTSDIEVLSFATDPRNEAQRNLDEWQDETTATREADYPL